MVDHAFLNAKFLREAKRGNGIGEVRDGEG
jgi:hypothetical protein